MEKVSGCKQRHALCHVFRGKASGSALYVSIIRNAATKLSATYANTELCIISTIYARAMHSEGEASSEKAFRSLAEFNIKGSNLK